MNTCNMRSTLSNTLKSNTTEPTTHNVISNDNTSSQSTAANRTSLNIDHDDIDGGWAWVVMVASFGCFILCGGVTYTSGVIHSVLLNKYNAQVSVTAWASGLYTAFISMSGKGRVLFLFKSFRKFKLNAI